MELIEIGKAAELTGLSKETLRKWEDRYGFPVPTRNIAGRRAYTVEQISRLRTVKNLIDQGVAPRFVVGITEAELQHLVEASQRSNKPTETIVRNWTLESPAAFRRDLTNAISEHGLFYVVTEYLPAIQHKIGTGWATGELAIWEEHLATEVISRVLRTAIADLPEERNGPKVLLTTAPGELHTMGLLMLEAALSQQGADCLYLGAELPLEEIAKMSGAHQVQIVALSFSIGYPRRKILPFLTRLRQELHREVDIWVGGGAVPIGKKLPAGVQEFGSIPAAVAALEVHKSQTSEKAI